MMLRATAELNARIDALLEKVAGQGEVLHADDIIESVRICKQAGRVGTPDYNLEVSIYSHLLKHAAGEMAINPRMFISYAVGELSSFDRVRDYKTMVEETAKFYPRQGKEAMVHSQLFSLTNEEEVHWFHSYLRTMRILQEKSWLVHMPPRFKGDDT